jgi:hypothetical protein
MTKVITGNVRNPVRMAVSGKNDSVVYVIVVQVVDHAVPIGTVAIPSVLRNCEHKGTGLT